MLNRGVNGERSDQIRARFARDAAQAAPEVVVIIAGVNDVYQGRSAASVERELEAMYAAARAAQDRRRRRQHHSLQHRDRRPERAHARGQRLDPRLRGAPRRGHGVLRHAGGGRGAGRSPTGSCPLLTTCIRLLRATD